MSIRDEIETFNAAVKRFEQALVAKFRSDPAEAEAVTGVAQHVSDHPLVKNAIKLAQEKALLESADADPALTASGPEPVPEEQRPA